MDDEQLLRVCDDVVDAVVDSLASVEDWEPAGERSGQYAIDLVADGAALSVLDAAGVGVLSEESGERNTSAALVAVIDPVDGSTNASRGIPWFASSICIVDEIGPRAPVVANLARHSRYRAVRGGGATCDGRPLRPSRCQEMRDAIVTMSGYPRRHMGWAQFRAFGAAALDLCAVADGTVDAFANVGRSRLGPWDYMGALLVCSEAGVPVVDLDGLDLVTLEHSARRAVAAAATPELMDQLWQAAIRTRPEEG